MPFTNRREAADRLAEALKAYQASTPLILAIPRGAVPMGQRLAQALDGELDVVLVRKLRAPFIRNSRSARSTNRAGSIWRTTPKRPAAPPPI